MKPSKAVEYVVTTDALVQEYVKFLKRVQALHSEYLLLHENRRLIAQELACFDRNNKEDPEVKALRKETRPRGRITRSSLEIRYAVQDMTKEFRQMLAILRGHHSDEGILRFRLANSDKK